MTSKHGCSARAGRRGHAAFGALAAVRRFSSRNTKADYLKPGERRWFRAALLRSRTPSFRHSNPRMLGTSESDPHWVVETRECLPEMRRRDDHVAGVTSEALASVRSGSRGAATGKGPADRVWA